MEAWMPKNTTPHEYVDQIRLSAWLHKQGIKHNASANGAKRSMMAGKKLKAMGMSKGFPDIEIPYKSGQYGCLYIEMKREKDGKPTTEQIEWINFLRTQNYYADFAYGFEEAKQIVMEYLALTPKAA